MQKGYWTETLLATPLPLQVCVESDRELCEGVWSSSSRPTSTNSTASSGRLSDLATFSPLASGSHVIMWSHNTRFVWHLWWCSVMQFVYSEIKLRHQTCGRCTAPLIFRVIPILVYVHDNVWISLLGFAFPLDRHLNVGLQFTLNWRICPRSCYRKRLG